MTDSETLTYKPKIGDIIDQTLMVVISMVAETGKQVVVPHSWDGKPFLVSPGETYSDVMQKWRDEWDRRSKATEATPEWQEYMRVQAEELVVCQAQADTAMDNIDELYFTEKGVVSHVRVIDWLASIRQATADNRINIDRAKIMCVLGELGYHPNVNCNEQFDESDENNFARYIIGQAMSDGRCIIDMRHTQQWLQRFGHLAKHK